MDGQTTKGVAGVGRERITVRDVLWSLNNEMLVDECYKVDKLMVKLMTGASEELDVFKGKERRKDWEMAR